MTEHVEINPVVIVALPFTVMESARGLSIVVSQLSAALSACGTGKVNVIVNDHLSRVEFVVGRPV